MYEEAKRLHAEGALKQPGAGVKPQTNKNSLVISSTTIQPQVVSMTVLSFLVFIYIYETIYIY